MSLRRPRILVLRAAGINCDEETAAAIDLAGGSGERVHVNRLVDHTVMLADYAGLVIPGGFSYGDHLGAGRLLALDLIHRLGDDLLRFVASSRPVLGICNGFQVLAKAGLLGVDANFPPQQTVTLAANSSGQYECRWIRVAPVAGNRSIFLRDITAPFALPVGHGEGRFVSDAQTLGRLEQNQQIALRYVDASGAPATSYPANPNGSAAAIAGLSNPAGTVLGLMPHPDRAYLPHLHPDWLRDKGRREGDGLPVFRNLVSYAGSL